MPILGFYGTKNWRNVRLYKCEKAQNAIFLFAPLVPCETFSISIGAGIVQSIVDATHSHIYAVRLNTCSFPGKERIGEKQFLSDLRRMRSEK